MGDKIKKFFSKIWERINQIDTLEDYENLTKEERAEVNNAHEVQKEVHAQKSFAQRVKVNKKDEVDPVIAKYGPAKPGNPIYDAAREMSRHEKELQEREH